MLINNTMRRTYVKHTKRESKFVTKNPYNRFKKKYTRTV